MHPVTFGYAGKWDPSINAVQLAANLVKSDPTPVGVEVAQGTPVPLYRVVSQNEYAQAAQAGRLTYTA